MKPSRLDSVYRRLFSKELVASGRREGFLAWVRSDGLGFELWSAGSRAGVVSSQALPLNVYSHLVATFDGVTMRLYVNGNLVGSASSALRLADTRAPFAVGSASYGSSPYNGAIDEPAVYGRALAAAEVTRHVAVARAAGWTPISGATGSSYTCRPMTSATICGWR